MNKQKRFQYRSKNGIVWTDWFNSGSTEEKWQEKNKLLNEYKEK